MLQAALIVLISLAGLTSALLSLLCVRCLRRSRRRVMPRIAPDDRMTPLHMTPPMIPHESESGDERTSTSPRFMFWSPRSPPVSSPLPLSSERLEELQPAYEEYALAYAVEQSFSSLHEPNAESADASERERLQAVECELVAALRTLPSQPWTVALARRQRGAPTSAVAAAAPTPAAPAAPAAAADADADGNARTVGTPACKGMLEDTDECSLCMDAFAEGEMVKMLRCEHYFHAHCIDDWFAHQKGKRRTCPVCSGSPV